MGKTNPTYRSVLDRLENQEWKDYRWMLRHRNQPLFDDLWEKARSHADAANVANPRPMDGWRTRGRWMGGEPAADGWVANPRPMDGALFSMLVAQQREIVDLQEGLEQLREEVGVNAGRIESLELEPSVDIIETERDRAEALAREERE